MYRAVGRIRMLPNSGGGNRLSKNVVIGEKRGQKCRVFDY